jgi:hypothetical protein
MKGISRRPSHILVTVVGLLSILLLIFITAQARATSTTDESAATGPDWAVAEAAAALPAAGIAPPAPQTDPCLHCHITGEDKGIWTPLSRWVVFGSAGLFFAFGMYRSASVWRTRTHWKPLTVRTAEWVDERYQVSEPLSKILSKPVPLYALRWFYCLGGITAFLFVIQAVTGILLAFYYKPTPEAAYASIQFIENEVRFGAGIRAVHHWAANGMIVMCVAHMLRVFHHGCFQATPRAQLGYRCGPAADDPGLWLHRLPASLGSARFLGYNGGIRNCGCHTRGRKPGPGILTGRMGCHRPDSQPFLCAACHRIADRSARLYGSAFSNDPAPGHC